ncbi:TIGR02453 family protein [Pseudoroseicyclus sp. H15]
MSAPSHAATQDADTAGSVASAAPLGDDFVAATREFLARLDANNDRDWFKAHKAEYDARLKAPAEALLEEMRAPLLGLTGHEATPKLYRPQRDVRFSRDKRPYNTHLHMSWALTAGGASEPVCFFGIGLDDVTVGLGTMSFDKEQLGRWRALLGSDAARMQSLADRAEAAGFAFGESELKRVPAPYDPDHPMARFLKMKSCVASRELGGNGPLVPRLTEAFREGLPVLELLHPVL